MRESTKRLRIRAAESLGFIVDTYCYPPVAYKGPRFQPTEYRLCYTDLEADLLAGLEQLVECVEDPPDGNCSCHISPPCNDCVEFSGLREALADARELIRGEV